jgi:hypothetical protein
LEKFRIADGHAKSDILFVLLSVANDKGQEGVSVDHLLSYTNSVINITHSNNHNFLLFSNIHQRGLYDINNTKAQINTQKISCRRKWLLKIY